MTGSNIGMLNAPRRSMACSIIRSSSASRALLGEPWASSFLERFLEAAHLPFGDRDDDLFFGLELPVHGGLRDTHLVGDHLQRRTADALVADQFQGRVHHPCLSGGARDRAEGAGLLGGRHSVNGNRRLTGRLPIGYRPSCRSATNVTHEESPTMRRPDGELILLGTLPVVAIIWISAFLLFPGFVHPMSPNMSADQVASFYQDEHRADPLQHDPVQLVRRRPHPDRDPVGDASTPDGPPHADPVLQLDRRGRRPAGAVPHRQHVLAARLVPARPRPELTQVLNDLAWLTFTLLVPYLIAQCLLLALAIYWDQQERPVFKPWVAYFNLVVAAALVPATFTALSFDGPFAWDGVLSFWLKNIAIAVWISGDGSRSRPSRSSSSERRTRSLA